MVEDILYDEQLLNSAARRARFFFGRWELRASVGCAPRIVARRAISVWTSSLEFVCLAPSRGRSQWNRESAG